MITLEPINDPIIIKRILMIDDLYKNIVLEDFETWLPDLFHTEFYIIYREELPFGIFMVERFCSNGILFHGGVFKHQRGKDTPKALREIINICKEIYGPKVFVTTISVDNLIVKKLLKTVGFKEKCIIENVALKGDMMILSE